MSYLISAPWNLSNCQICLKKEIPKFGTKKPYWVFLTMNDLFGYIWNQHPQICIHAEFFKKTKMPKVWSKNALFGYFWARVLKNCCHNWNQHPHFFQIGKFCRKSKMPKFGSKNALFGLFWARILKISYLCIFRLEF